MQENGTALNLFNSWCGCFKSSGMWSDVVGWIHSDVPMDHSAFMFRLLLGLFDTEKDPSKRREIFSQQHGVTAQKGRSNTAVRISPLGTLDVFVLERKNLADVRRLSWPNAVIMLEVSCRGSGGGVGMNKPAPPTRVGSCYTGILKNWCTRWRYNPECVSLTVHF